MFKFKRLFAVLFISLTLLFTVQKANAFWDQYGTYTTAITAMSAGGTGFAVASATGTFLSITPIGWAGIGLVLAAAVLMASDTSGHKTAVVVSSLNNQYDPNPDYTTTTSTTSSTNPAIFVLPGVANIYFNISEYPLTKNSSFVQNAISYYRNHGFDIVDYWVCNPAPSGSACGTDTSSQKFFGFITSGGSKVGFSALNTISHLECAVDSTYAPVSNLCVSNTNTAGASLSDGICRISWDPTTGCPVRNPFDPDCAAVAPTLSCGNSTISPSVTVVDPVTKTSLRTERPQLATQGTPGAVKLISRSIDSSTNTTKEYITQTQPQSSPTLSPTTVGSTTNVYPGTGSATSSSPASSVAISNWPSQMNVDCPNCSGRVKIDGEVPSEYVDLPAAPTTFESTTKFLDPLKTRLASFMHFQLPAHTSSCPDLRIQWSAWNLSFDYSSSYMCQLLENNRAVFEGLLTFLYIASAILIVLGA